MTKIRDREQIVDAAARVFAEKGFDAASMEDIAAAVGVLQGSLYYHVGSKAELLFLVQRRRLIAIADAVSAIADSPAPPREKLARAIAAHLHHLAEHFPESSQWFTEPGRASEGRRGDGARVRGARPRVGDEADPARIETRELNRRYVQTWARIVAESVDPRRQTPPLDPQVAARAILGMCNWVPRWFRADGPESMDDICAMLTGMLLDGLLGAASSAP